MFKTRPPGTPAHTTLNRSEIAKPRCDVPFSLFAPFHSLDLCATVGAYLVG